MEKWNDGISEYWIEKMVFPLLTIIQHSIISEDLSRDHSNWSKEKI
jgi:hypothetical protein